METIGPQRSLLEGAGPHLRPLRLPQVLEAAVVQRVSASTSSMTKAGWSKACITLGLGHAKSAHSPRNGRSKDFGGSLPFEEAFSVNVLSWER